MYSKKEKDKIRNLERANFRELKKEENKNRAVPTSPDILYISNFDLEKFPNTGDSGELYLATNKYNPSEKYILKHEYYDCACNEYIYSKIGSKMGIKIAPVKLFILDDKEDEFKSDFVCGIKYFENCKNVNYNYIDKNKNNIGNWQDYFRMRSLESLFQESDGIEIIEYDNEIYRIDTTSSFTISCYFINLLAYDYNNHGINVREYANKKILQLAIGNSDLRISMWKSDVDSFLKKFEAKYLDYYLEPFKSFEKVTKENIEEWVNVLTYFYPNIIGEYFQEYFKNLKLDVQKFLIEIEKQTLITT